MQLRSIGYQRGKGKENENFSSVYESHFAEKGSDWFQKVILNTTRLLRYVEENVEAPPHWVCTSHSSCVFYAEDYAEYGLSESNKGRKFTISASGTEDDYSIQVPLDIEENNFCSVTIHSSGLESTAKFISQIISGELAFAAVRK